MIITVTDDKLWLKLKYESENERMQAISSFRKKVKDWRFKKKKFSNWKGDVDFIVGERKDLMYPGLWHQLIKFGKRFGYPIKFVNQEALINNTITKEWVEKFCVELFRGHPTHSPRPDQINAVYMALRHYYHTEHLATSAGKTLIIYCIFMALLHLKLCSKILIITPDPDLAIQNYDEFMMYDNGKYGLKIALMHGGSKAKDIGKYKVAIGNFQFLANRDASFFESYDAILCDECVSEDTILNADYGDVEIKDINVGDYIQAADFDNNIIFDEVINKWYRGKRIVYKICLENGHFIEGTCNHEIYTNFGWLTVEQIIKIYKENEIVLYINDGQKSGTIDSRKFVGRYAHRIRMQEQQLSENKGIAFHKAREICTREISYIKGFGINSPKNDKKWGVWKIPVKIFNPFFAYFGAILQFVYNKWQKNCNERMARYAYRRRSGLLVYGRWLITWQNINLLIFCGRKRIDKEVFHGKMEYIGGNSLSQAQISIHNNVSGKQKQIVQVDRALYNTIYDIQGFGYGHKEELLCMPKGIHSSYKDCVDMFGGMSENKKIPKERRMDSKEKTVTSKILSIKENGFRNVYDIETKKTHTFFGNGILVHNCQKAKSTSIKDVVDNAGSLVYRGGYSGSITPDNFADYFTVLAYFGPTVAKITKKELMDRGDAAQINIEIYTLSYADDELRKELYRAKLRLDGDKVLNLERRFIRESPVRLEWICQLANKLNGNTLIFFLDVKTSYGKDIANKIKSITTHKEIYYLDGSISNKDRRREIMRRMEEGDDKILVANWGIFGVGKSVKNIRNILCAENRKDDGVINQGTGRGMRIDRDTGKDEFVWIDIVDDFSIMVSDANGNDDVFYNYMMKWKNDRIRYYKSEGFEYNKYDIDLTSGNSSMEW